MKRCNRSYENKAVSEWIELNGKRKLKSLQCKICNKKISKSNPRDVRRNFIHHLKRHEESTKHCSKCDINFDTINELVNHNRAIHDNGLKCDECSKVLASEENLRMHIENIHRKILECNLCNYKITGGGHSEQNEFKKHCLAHKTGVGEEKTRIINLGGQCPEEGCSMIFPRPGDLNHHIKRKHILKTCPVCGIQVKILYAHMYSHQKDSDKPFRCDKCGKGFSQQHKMQIHVEKAHLDVRFYCRFPDCPKKEQPFTESSNRDAHERKKHGVNYSQLMKMSMIS